MEEPGFRSDEQLAAYVAQNGIDALRSVVRSGRLNDLNTQRAQSWVNQWDTDEAAARQADVDAQMILAANRAADAAESQASSARKALRVSYWALGISLVALAAAIAQAFGVFR